MLSVVQSLLPNNEQYFKRFLGDRGVSCEMVFSGTSLMNTFSEMRVGMTRNLEALDL